MKNDIDISSVLSDWWYYSVELKPGVIVKGIYPDMIPMLPRILMRNCSLLGMDCLDLGSMEGIIPVLMSRQGAKSVVASDAVTHCLKKMEVLAKCYDVSFDFRQIGLMYDISEKLKDYNGFDFINLSGVLYHVFSPMHVLAGVRPLLKKNGLIIVSTNVINRCGYFMEFNDRGRLQVERNTFWYLSVSLFEYLLKYFKLLPIDCLYYPHSQDNPLSYVDGLSSGYLSVICRAIDEEIIDYEDQWAIESRLSSWEYLSLCNTQMLSSQSDSIILYRGDPSQIINKPANRIIDLFEAVNNIKHVILRVDNTKDSHILKLSDDE